jgi:hypothetical protein
LALKRPKKPWPEAAAAGLRHGCATVQGLIAQDFVWGDFHPQHPQLGPDTKGFKGLTAAIRSGWDGHAPKNCK